MNETSNDDLAGVIGGFIDNLKAENAALLAENAALRETISELPSITEYSALQEDNEALRHALRLWLAWREGPEGPEVLFSEGTKALKATRKVLEENP